MKVEVGDLVELWHDPMSKTRRVRGEVVKVIPASQSPYQTENVLNIVSLTRFPLRSIHYVRLASEVVVL